VTTINREPTSTNGHAALQRVGGSQREVVTGVTLNKVFRLTALLAHSTERMEAARLALDANDTLVARRALQDASGELSADADGGLWGWKDGEPWLIHRANPFTPLDPWRG
jgi:hypothetical protein